MRAKTEFEKTIKLTKTALFLSGINIFLEEWNRWTRTFVDSIAYYLNIVGLYFVLIGEMYWLIDGTITGKSFVELSLIVPCLTISVLATAKVHYLYHNKESLLDVVDKLREIYPDEIEESANDNDQCLNDKKGREYDNDVTEVGIVNEANELLKFVNFLLSTVSFVVTMTFCTMPLFKMAGEFMETGKFVVLYPFAVKYPFDVYNTSFWVIVYINQFWATIIVCTNIFGVDTLFYALCSYIGMNFRLLSYKFEHLEIKRNDRTINEIIVLIKRHQELIELVNKTQSLYSLSTLFNIVTSSLLICLSGFNITVADDISTILAFFTFLVMSFSQISLLCYFGDMIMKSSTDVCDGIYKCPWYNIDAKTKKIIVLIMLRAQKPCKLSAASFADINLRVFTTILSRSWSYFALLKTIYS